MKKMKTKMKNQSFTCSNPRCGRVFVNPIIVQDLSLKNDSSYSSCPYCLTEITTEKTSAVKDIEHAQTEKETKIKEAKKQLPKIKSVHQPSLEEHKCPYHFGYLSQRSKNETIPEECIICEKIVKCMLKKVTG